MEVKRNLLNHFKVLQQSLAQVQAEAFINVHTFVVEARLQNRIYRLYPQFVARVNGNKVYTTQFTPDVRMFAGWRPYVDRPVPDLAHKLRFKALLAEQGFATPPFATDAKSDLADVVVKKYWSSFGAQISGPFRFACAHPLNADAEEYYEKFILGDIVKIWFWNAQPVCLERRKMPAVAGNGRDTISRLVQQKIAGRKKKMPKWECVSELLAFYGKTLDTVLAVDEKQIIDFRYASEFFRPKHTKETRLVEDLAGFSELPRLARMLSERFPPSVRDHVVYSIDAILDGENKLWFLEINFNPFVHPHVYPWMIASLQTFNDYKELRVAPGVH